jgi:hydrogenase small subunit
VLCLPAAPEVIMVRDKANDRSLRAKLELHGISRRDFLGYCGALAAAIGLPACSDDSDGTRKDAGPAGGGDAQVADALADAADAGARGKPTVLWLAGQDCNGCLISFLNLDDDPARKTPSIASVLLDTISLRYHEAVMAATGEVAETVKEGTIKAGGYILIVDGAIPTADDRYCLVGGVPVRETMLKAAKNASHIIALGSCATSGGVTRNTVSAGRPVTHFIKDRTVINLPMCPANGEHLLLTVVHLLTQKTPPKLDKQGRPEMFFSESVHFRCPRLKSFAAGKFLTDWNDPAQKDYCLLQKGCKGPATHADCPTRGFNGGVSHCTAVGAPCQGCAEDSFYDGKPLYAKGT